MKEEVNFTELEKSLNKIGELTTTVSSTLSNIDQDIKDNIGNGSGIWDSPLSYEYRKKWDDLSNDFKIVVDSFEQQEKNLLEYINTMKKVDE